MAGWVGGVGIRGQCHAAVTAVVMFVVRMSYTPFYHYNNLSSYVLMFITDNANNPSIFSWKWNREIQQINLYIFISFFLYSQHICFHIKICISGCVIIRFFFKEVWSKYPTCIAGRLRWTPGLPGQRHNPLGSSRHHQLWSHWLHYGQEAKCVHPHLSLYPLDGERYPQEHLWAEQWVRPVILTHWHTCADTSSGTYNTRAAGSVLVLSWQLLMGTPELLQK